MAPRTQKNADAPTREARIEARLGYCGALVRRLDYDRYVVSLFAPADRREALFALYAFNAEIARVPETVSEPMLGRIRLQWWRESLDAIFAGGPVRDQPVARALGEAARKHGLPRAPFDRLIDAREADLDFEPPPTLAALEAYADDTAAPLFELADAVLGADASESRTSTGSLGTAWALAGLVRAAAHHARARRQYLPADLMTETGARAADLFAPRSTPALAEVARRIADRAAEHLAAAVLPAGPPDARRHRALFAKLTEKYLKKLNKAGYDPLSKRIGLGRLTKQIAVARAARRVR